MTAEEIEELKRTKDESGEPKGEEDRDRDQVSQILDIAQDNDQTHTIFEKYQTGVGGELDQSREITKDEQGEAGDKNPAEPKEGKKRDDER